MKDRIELLANIKRKYKNNEITFEEAQSLIRENFTKVTPVEIAFSEQETNENCIDSNILHTLDLFEGLIDTQKTDLDDNHPIQQYYKENKFIKEIDYKKLLEKDFVLNAWLGVYDTLKEYKIHYDRKQNQIYPILAKKGFTKPNEVMWDYDISKRKYF